MNPHARAPLLILPTVALWVQGCAAMVPRPELLSDEPPPELGEPPAGPAAKRPVAPRPALACLPKPLAEHGRVTLAKMTASDTVAFCMQPVPDNDEVPLACFQWTLGSEAFQIIPRFEPAPPVTEPPSLPSGLTSSEDAVSTCDAQGKCTPVVTTKALGKGEQYRRDLENRLLARASSDGKLLALVHLPAGTADPDSGEVEVWGVAQKKRLRRFRVTSQGHGDQVGSLRFVGSLLLVEQCDAGPACTGRLFEPATGKELLEVPVNFYGAEMFALDSAQWVFVDGWLDGAAIVDVSTGRLVRRMTSGETGPASDAGRVARDAAGELHLVFSGADDEREQPLGGVVIRLSLVPTVPNRRYAPPICSD